MRILFLDHGQYITVAVPKLMEMAESLASQGHEVEVALTSRTRRFRMERIRLRNVSYTLFPSWMCGRFRHGADPYDAARRTLHYTGFFPFDIIHARDSRPTVILPAIALHLQRRAPLILEWGDYFGGGGSISERSGRLYRHTLAPLESFFERCYRRRADGSMVVSKFLRERLVEMGVPEHRILLTRHGTVVDESALRPKKEAKNKLGWSPDSVHAVYFGRIYPNDHDLLASAVAVAAKQVPRLKVVVAGSVPNSMRKNLPNLQYTGWVSEHMLADMGNAADYFLLPLTDSLANRARWPSKIGTYLGFSKPVLATRASDAEEIFQDSEIGVLTGCSPAEFAAGMIRISESTDRWEEWGSNALGYARQRLDWALLTGRLVRFYEKILNDEARRWR